MKGTEFQHAWQQLFDAQKAKEDTLDMAQIEAVAHPAGLPTRRNLQDLSDFFVDPTLFGLLRQYNDTQTVAKRQTKRVRLVNGDHLIRSKPQAKDVQPNRVLEEQDEHYWRELQSRHDPDTSGYYLNPKVPKKRRYFTETRANAASPSPFPSTPSTSMPATPATPATWKDDAPTGENEDDDDDNATVATSTTVSTMATDLPQGGIVNQLDQAPLTHADIPETRIYKKFADMAHALQHSPLRSLRSKLLLDTLPRHRIQVNYANIPQHTKKDVSAGPLEHRVIYNIAIYHPNKPSKRLVEYQFLGMSTLQAVRDSLFCISDFYAHGDRLNQQADGTVLNTPQKKTSASYFCIDGQFYKDERCPNQDQYKHMDDLVQWTRDHTDAGANAAPPLPMHDAKLQDIDLAINQPYLFSHQKLCQHVVLVRSIRLMNAHDEQDEAKYPVAVYNWRYTRYKCTMCTIYPAEYITTNDYLSGFSPCYFCKECFRPFHYDADGNQVSTFDVCDYYGS
ncbi:snRNA-activating protein of 50kDa MW C terminal-domain-containing protein [Gongronella butleri]|nr:snRNA-activating protein of 50kDa MW C terminal-domain-containing protein [Gongronella butleri]